MSNLPHLQPGAKQRRVVCAANRLTLYDHWNNSPPKTVLALGVRHFDPTMRSHIEAHAGAENGTRADWGGSQQGFIDQWGTFMDRHEAFLVAKAAGQILYGPHLPNEELDSSDLY